MAWQLLVREVPINYQKLCKFLVQLLYSFFSNGLIESLVNRFTKVCWTRKACQLHSRPLQRTHALSLLEIIGGSKLSTRWLGKLTATPSAIITAGFGPQIGHCIVLPISCKRMNVNQAS